MENISAYVLGITVMVVAFSHWWVDSSISRAAGRIAGFRGRTKGCYMAADQAATAGRMDRLGMMVEYIITRLAGTCRYRHGISVILMAPLCAASVFLPEPRDALSAFLGVYILGAVAPACLLHRLIGLVTPFAGALQLAYAFKLSMKGFVVIMKGRELGLYGDKEQELLDAELDTACGKCCAMAEALGLAGEMNAALRVSRPGCK